MTERKRKRGSELSHGVEKRRHVSPKSNEEKEARINGDGALSIQVEDDAPLSEDDVEGSDEEEEGDGPSSDAEGKDLAGVNGTTEGRSGTKPKKPPTGEELRNIKDATDLYRSSAFKLQIDALLPNVRPKYQHSAALDRFLLALHSFLKALPSINAQHPLSASSKLLKKGIAVPYPTPLPTEDTNWKVAFEAPTELTLVGSWPTKLSVKSKDKRLYNVDLAVEMPAALFQEKDYMNGRFFHKRAYYLAVIANAIAKKKSGFNVDVLFDSASGDPRLTTLVLRSKQDASANDFSKLHVQVRLIPTLPSDSPIPIQRLSPQRCNIRTSSSSEDASETLSTPLYNTALLLSTTPRAHLLRVYHLKQEMPAFDNALTLLRVWANQRGYGEGTKLSVRGFEGKGIFWASVLDLLVNGEEASDSTLGHSTSKRKSIGRGISSYQLFRASLDFFVRHDFSQAHVFLKSENGHRFSPQEYSVHEAVFVDSTSSVNLLAGVPLTSLELLKHDAKITLEALNSRSLTTGSTQDPFQEVFLKDTRDLQTRFDVTIRIDLSSAKPPKLSALNVLDHGSPYNALMASVISTLRRGLSDRTKAIAVLHPSSEPRPISQAHPSNPPVVYIGLVLDTEHAFRLVDHGPAADSADPAAAESFRGFWGEKAELRRFKDGSITESVVWDVKNADERAHIPFYISRYLLSRHCGIDSQDIRGWQTSYDSLLRLPESITTFYQAASAATGFKAAMTAFDGLVKSIKALDDELPLAILNVSPVAESLRYTNTFSPVALPLSLSPVLPSSATYFPAMDIIIEFEKSGRWPDDLRAIQKIKLAFFETLGSALMSAVKGLQASVVVGDGVSTSEIQDTASLDIVTPDGWAFHARIWHDREAFLLDKLIDDKPHIPKHIKKQLQNTDKSGIEAKERQAALDAKDIYTRRFIHAPRHHRVIAALSHRYSAYASTVRLAKRWLASHWLLGGHVKEEAVELLCASIFLGTEPSSNKDWENMPGTKERGFARLVELLKDWEWAEGLFVPVYGPQDGSEGSAAIPAVPVHAGSKSGVWRISTEFDPEGFMWTSTGPDAVVARRIKAVAKAAWACLQGIEGDEFDVKTLFVHPTEDYDFLIHLNPSVLPRYYQNIVADQSVWKAGKYANATLSNGNAKTHFKPGFDPAQLYFDDLKRIYKDTFKIFYDPLGGDRFGAVWDPTLKTSRPFRVLGGFSSIPARAEDDKSKDKALVTFNTDAVLSEIERLGTELVSGLTVQV